MGYVIGADIGSQSVKALLMDPGGAAVATAAEPCSMSHPHDGWAEQDPGDWRRCLAGAVRAVTSAAGIDGREVEALALASQVDGVVAIDEDCEPLRPAIIWLDRRATKQAAVLRATVGGDELAARTGLNADASHTGPKAMWIRDTEPEVYARTRWLASAAGYLNAWLTGEVVEDHAVASSSLLYDLERRDWAEDLVAASALDPHMLPPIRPAVATIGPIRRDAADALGLARTCTVVVGTGDDHAAALGAGAIDVGVVVDISGTAEPVAAPSPDVVLDDRRILETHAHAVDRMLLVENPGFVSGGSTQWLARVHGITQADVFERASEAPAGSDGVIFLPALSGSTAPRWNDRMRGGFGGLAMNHDLRHLARAVLEGCAYALRDILDRLDAVGLGADEVRVVGGGARSQTWLQIKADATGRAMRPCVGHAATSTGAAMLAATATGIFRDIRDAADHCVEVAVEPVMPRACAADAYAEGYRRYRRFYDGAEEALA